MISHSMTANYSVQLVTLSSSRSSTSPWCLGASKAQSSAVLHDRTNSCPVSYPSASNSPKVAPTSRSAHPDGTPSQTRLVALEAASSFSPLPKETRPANLQLPCLARNYRDLEGSGASVSGFCLGVHAADQTVAFSLFALFFFTLLISLIQPPETLPKKKANGTIKPCRRTRDGWNMRIPKEIFVGKPPLCGNGEMRSIYYTICAYGRCEDILMRIGLSIPPLADLLCPKWRLDLP